MIGSESIIQENCSDLNQTIKEEKLKETNVAQSIGMFTAELNAMLWFGDSPKHISAVLGKLMEKPLLNYCWPGI